MQDKCLYPELKTTSFTKNIINYCLINTRYLELWELINGTLYKEWIWVY